MNHFQLKLIGARTQLRLDRLEQAFNGAAAPLRRDLERIEREARHADAATLAAPVGEDAWDYATDLAERRDDAIDSLNQLRKAFALLFYHQWERAAQRWTTANRPNHDDMIAAAKALAISVDEPALDLLRVLANTIKHNSDRWGADLRTRRPNMFYDLFDPAANNPLTGQPFSTIDWADNIAMTDKDIEELSEAVRNSVPR